MTFFIISPLFYFSYAILELVDVELELVAVADPAALAMPSTWTSVVALAAFTGLIVGSFTKPLA